MYVLTYVNYICMCLYMFNDICMCLYMFTAISKITSLTCINLWCKEKMVFKDIWPFKWDSIHMEFSMAGQRKCDLLIEMTAWEGLTLFSY